MDESKQPGILIGQIHILRAHFEHREDVLTLPADTKLPELNVEVGVQIGQSEDGSEGLIIVAVRTHDQEKAPYSFQIEMVGLVKQEETKNLSVKEYLVNNGVATMYPFLREAVANITGRGRFGPIWLKPFNTTMLQLDETKNPESNPDPPGDAQAGQK